MLGKKILIPGYLPEMHINQHAIKRLFCLSLSNKCIKLQITGCYTPFLNRVSKRGCKVSFCLIAGPFSDASFRLEIAQDKYWSLRDYLSWFMLLSIGDPQWEISMIFILEQRMATKPFFSCIQTATVDSICRWQKKWKHVLKFKTKMWYFKGWDKKKRRKKK